MELRERKKVYTIEFGYFTEDKERYCTNEVSFLEHKDYFDYLKQLLIETIGTTKTGYYIECYFDEEDLEQEDIDNIINHKYMDYPSKTNIIQQFIIDNTGDCIDYIYKE